MAFAQQSPSTTSTGHTSSKGGGGGMAGYMMSSIKRPAVSATKASGDQSSMPLEDALAILLQGEPESHSLEIHHEVS